MAEQVYGTDSQTAVHYIANIINIAIFCLFIALVILAIRALIKYTKSKDVRKEKTSTRVSLGEAIKEHRTRCKMTQEFVAESLGVSRQAVSKWESRTSDPSTSNLIALANLFDISAEELLKEVAHGSKSEKNET